MATNCEECSRVLVPSRNRHRGPHPRHKDRFTTPSGMILNGLGDGAGSVPWQSDVMPTQFYRHPSWGSEKLLLWAVLVDAKQVAKRSVWLRDRERLEARAWFASHSDTYTFDFESICQELGLDADRIRAGVLAGGD